MPGERGGTGEQVGVEGREGRGKGGEGKRGERKGN